MNFRFDKRMINLYDYQLDLYNKAIESFRKGNRRVLISAPCGAGKSYLFAYMCEQTIKNNKSVLVLVHRKELAEQHRDLFKKLNIPTDKIRIALFFSESRHLGKYPKPDLIIADEAHWIPDSLKRVLDYYNTYTIGLTATPCRLTGEPMGAVYKDLIVGVSVKDLIKMKKLAPYDYYSVTIADISGLSIRHGDYATGEAEALLMQTAIYGDVIASYKRFAEGKKTIVYCASKKHSEAMAQKFREAGYAAEHFDSDTPKKERYRIMSDFRSGKVKIICNVMLIVEGISVDDCECCILLRPTLSTTIFIQSAMRCMRYQPKKRAVIIDCVANYAKLGFPADEREWSLNDAVKPKKNVFNDDGTLSIRTCSECFKCFKTASKCPYCGAEYIVTPREIKQIQAVELHKIEEENRIAEEERKKQARMEVGKCRSYEELLKIEKERGYKNGWAYFKARAKGLL